MDSQKGRILIATLLSFVFFILYDYFYLSKLAKNDINATQKTEISTKAPVSSKTPDLIQKPEKKSNSIVKFKSEFFHGEIDEYGRISQFILDEKQYIDEKGKQISVINETNSPLPLEIRFVDEKLNNLAFSTPYTANFSELDIQNGKNSVILTQNLQGVIVNKKIEFSPKGDYKLEVSVSDNSAFFITTGLRPNVVVDGYTVHGGMIRLADEKLKILEDGDLSGDERFSNANIVAASDRYYTSLFFSPDSSLNVVATPDSKENILFFIEAKGNFKTTGYIGPKAYDTLNAINLILTDVIEYGWFTWIAKPVFKVLKLFFGFFENWGWAIVAMTILLRIILLPLTYRGMMSMNKLKDLAPKIKEIQAKYKGDPQKMQAHMMELYKKNNANPMGGCLPILLQIPIFFAVYRVLLNAIELKGAEWILWIQDLAVKDPYFILPILMGLTMFLQQKLTPTTFTDPMQEKIMKWLPLIFTFFFMTFPAGLTLYWFINNLCSVGQQIFINKMFEKHKAQKALEAKNDN